jgi:hypothetical protein
MKPRTLEDLEDALDSEVSWRQKEISDVTMLIQHASGPKRKCLLRCGLAVLYAHWEGFVKAAVRLYVAFVALQRKTCNELDATFVALAARKHLMSLVSESSQARAISVVSYLRSAASQEAELPTNLDVDTESNLTSKVLRRIACLVGIDYKPFELKANFIDASLVAVRNSIAHGEHVHPALADYITAKDEVFILIRMFRNEISNGAAVGSYKAA